MRFIRSPLPISSGCLEFVQDGLTPADSPRFHLSGIWWNAGVAIAALPAASHLSRWLAGYVTGDDRENPPLVTDAPVDLESSRFKFKNCRKVADHYREICRITSNSSEEKPKDVYMKHTTNETRNSADYAPKSPRAPVQVIGGGACGLKKGRVGQRERLCDLMAHGGWSAGRWVRKSDRCQILWQTRTRCTRDVLETS